jgi:cytochrome d ubiquinol oxidase subunit II
MTFQNIWFVLWGVLWTVYFVTDGFDLGAGMLQLFLARDEKEHQAVIGSVGPFWSGNEVWLVTAGGATFAAFPAAYAVMFSVLYTALLLLLFSLIVRGVAVELRHKEELAWWRQGWDIALGVSSFVAALLFGVAFGNIFEGLPMDAAGFHGGLFTLLNPYGLVTGVLFVLLFLVHGGLWLACKTQGALSARCAAAARGLWLPLAAVAVVFLVYTKPATRLYDNFFASPALFILPLLAVAALFAVRWRLAQGQAFKAFLASCVTVGSVVATGVVGLYPSLLPSRLDAQYSLTAFNSSSSPYTLKIMTVVALLCVPAVIAYQFWNYWLFRQEIDPAKAAGSGDLY